MTYGNLLNKSSFRSSVEFVLVFSGIMHMYVLLLIALNSWHLCFNRGILRRKLTGYVLLPNFILSGSIQHRFFVLASALSSICAKKFSHLGRCVPDVCIAVFGSWTADGTINLFT